MFNVLSWGDEACPTHQPESTTPSIITPNPVKGCVWIRIRVDNGIDFVVVHHNFRKVLVIDGQKILPNNNNISGLLVAISINYTINTINKQ